MPSQNTKINRLGRFLNSINLLFVALDAGKLKTKSLAESLADEDLLDHLFTLMSHDRVKRGLSGGFHKDTNPTTPRSLPSNPYRMRMLPDELWNMIFILSIASS